MLEDSVYRLMDERDTSTEHFKPQGPSLAAETRQTKMTEMVDGRSSVCSGVSDNGTKNMQSEFRRNMNFISSHVTIRTVIGHTAIELKKNTHKKKYNTKYG